MTLPQFEPFVVVLPSISFWRLLVYFCYIIPCLVFRGSLNRSLAQFRAIKKLSQGSQISKFLLMGSNDMSVTAFSSP